MIYLSENEFNEQMKKAQLRNESLLRKQELRKERNKYKPQRKKIQTSKIFFVLLFLSCSSAQFFAMAAMWHFGNLDHLGTLLLGTLSEGIGILGYYCKSYFESKEEEKLKFEKEKFWAVNQSQISTCDEISEESGPVG